MQLAGCRGDPQRLALAEQMLLPDHRLDAMRPHQIGERRLGRGIREQIVAGR
jgi:hypothetical protein